MTITSLAEHTDSTGNNFLTSGKSLLYVTDTGSAFGTYNWFFYSSARAAARKDYSGWGASNSLQDFQAMAEEFMKTGKAPTKGRVL